MPCCSITAFTGSMEDFGIAILSWNWLHQYYKCGLRSIFLKAVIIDQYGKVGLHFVFLSFHQHKQILEVINLKRQRILIHTLEDLFELCSHWYDQNTQKQHQAGMIQFDSSFRGLSHSSQERHGKQLSLWWPDWTTRTVPVSVEHEEESDRNQGRS